MHVATAGCCFDGANMFRKINVPLLGIVENKSHYECPACGHKEHILGKEGALRTGEAMKMDVLGQVGGVREIATLRGGIKS